MVFLLLIEKGVIGDGQSSLFSNALRTYIEETSASIQIPKGQSHDLNTLTAVLGNNFGRGGQENIIDPATVQDNSIIGNNPISMDYGDLPEYKRSRIVEYEVQAGDVLSFIASDYGVSINSIIWANNLKGADSIQPGQILKIPPISGVIHIVKKGDTIASIAKKYGGDTAKIVEFNGLPQNGEIQLDDEMIIPDGVIKTAYSVTSTGARTVSSSPTKPFSYLPDFGDYFMPPTSGYNWKRLHGRNGDDIANSCGTPVYAAADGVVTVADGVGYNGGFGKYIKISHPNGTETLYAHSMKLLVSAGEAVTRGQKIMLMGTTGRSTGCHLHFEVHGARNPMLKY